MHRLLSWNDFLSSNRMDTMIVDFIQLRLPWRYVWDKTLSVCLFPKRRWETILLNVYVMERWNLFHIWIVLKGTVYLVQNVGLFKLNCFVSAKCQPSWILKWSSVIPASSGSIFRVLVWTTPAKYLNSGTVTSAHSNFFFFFFLEVCHGHPAPFYTAHAHFVVKLRGEGLSGNWSRSSVHQWISSIQLLGCSHFAGWLNTREGQKNL